MATNLLALADYVQDQGEIGRQRHNRNLLSGAASRAYGAAPDQADAAIRDAIAVDHTAGYKIAEQSQADQLRRGQQLYNMARGLKQISTTSPEAAAAFYERQLVPGLKRMGFEVQDTYDAARVMPVVDQVLAQFQPTGQGGVQSTKILENGNIGIVTRSGQVVDTGQRAAPNTRLIEQEGQVPFLVTTSGGRAGETTAIGGQPASVGVQVGQTRVAIDGVSPEQSQRIARTAEAMRSAGFPDADIDAWVSSQSDQLPASTASAAPMPVRTPTRAETAASEAQAKANVELANYGRMSGLEAEREAQKVMAREAAEKQAEARANLGNTLSNADDLTGLIDQAIAHPGREASTGLSSSFDPRNYVAGTDATNFGVLLDQIKGKAFLQAFNSLKGAGAITEQEGRQATAAFGRLNTRQSDDEFLRSLQEIKTIIAMGRARAIQKAQGRAASAAQPATQAAAPQRARNPSTGQVIELRNGQWVPVDG